MMNYQELVHISKIVISLPVSNACPERDGSAIKRIKQELQDLEIYQEWYAHYLTSGVC